MPVSNRIPINFDTNKFGDASTLTSNASNTLTLIANTTGPLKDWQSSDLANGAIQRTNYFQNPTLVYLQPMLANANTIFVTANNLGDTLMMQTANNLMIEILAFESHTDNISGTVAVSNNMYPSLASAQNMGQLNMMTLARTDGVEDTTPILGSFTSLFIQDELKANANQISYYTKEYVNSVTATYDPMSSTYTYSSNISPSEIVVIKNYLSNTQNVLSSRRTGDWEFYANSMQLSQDVSFFQQLNGMGSTMTYLVKNVVGKPSLVTNLNNDQAGG